MKQKYIILLTLFCYSCVNTNNLDKRARYSENYNSFDKEMVNHIPEKMPNNQIGFGFYSPKYTKFGQLYLLTKVSSKTEFLKLKTKLSKQALYCGTINDKCFAIVDIFKSTTDLSCSNNCKTILPIPLESISYTEDFPPSNQDSIITITKRFENAEVIIKEFKLGNFLSVMDSKSNESASTISKTGFSKGFTFVEKDLIIIYWVMNW